MQRSDESQRAFYLLRALTRALGHRIRTPLSIISNDLHYFESQIPDAGAAKTRVQCERIAQILKEGSLPGGDDLAFEQIECASFLAAIHEIPTHSVAGCFLRGDRERLHFAFGKIEALLSAQNKSGEDEGLSIDVEKSDHSVSIRYRALLTTFVTEEGARFNSFSSCFSGLMDSDAISPLLIDAVLWAHQADIFLSVSAQIEACITLPLGGMHG